MTKNYLLSFILFCCAFVSFGQTTIAIQDFETTPATPTLNYSLNTGSFTSLSGNSGSAFYPTNSPLYTSSNTSWSVSDDYVDADFGPIDIRNYNSVQLEFDLASFAKTSGNGADGGDYIDIYISLDNGVTWSYELEITGNSNARWNFSSGTNRTITYDGDDNPSSYSSSSSNPINNLIINIPDAVASTTPNLLVGFVVNNNNVDEIWNIDDIKVTGIPTATNTQVQFASSTYTESEDGTSVNLCVDIINESASSATTAQVVLTSGTAPHLSYTTQNITFPANSSAQQCVTVNIADNTNCGDSTDYTFEIQNVAGGDSAAAGSVDETTLSVTDDDGTSGTAYIQDFDGGTPTWNYTGDGNNGATYGNTGNGRRISDGDSFTLSNIDVSSLSNIIFSLKNESSGGIENADALEIYVALDGASFNAIPDITIQESDTGDTSYNKSWNYTASGIASTSAGTPANFYGDGATGYSTVNINIPDGTFTVSVKITGNTNNTSEYFHIDDIILSGESCSTIISDTNVSFVSTTSTLTEDGIYIDVCASIANESSTNATTVDITLDGASTATNGTDYDDGAGTPAAISFPQTLTFPAGSTADQCITIFISNDDSVIESDETVVLNLTNPSGGNAAILGANTTHTLTITDNDFYDDCSTSITIPVNSSCINQSFTNVGATDSGIADPSCGAYSGGDVWFNLVVPASGSVTVETSENGGITDSGMALYTGTCGALTLVTCDDDSGTGNMSMISASGLTPGSTLYVRVWEYNNNDFDTFNLCAYSANEIDVERNTFASIANGNAANTGNNTVFGATEVGATATAKNYYIRNEGSADLSITSIVSSNPTEFVISTNPAPIVIAAGGIVGFDIEFSPSALGTRTGTITIVNDDSDENPYTFGVSGTGTCAAGSITISPESGPVDTVVTVVGTNLLTATAAFNGLAATVTNISATEMEVVVPAGATSGSLEITDSLGCPASTPFTVIDSQITSCEGNSGVVPTDLFISEITDATYGGLSYVEIFNGTGTAINIDNYSLEVIANGDATAAAINIFDLENYIMPNGTTYVIAIGRQSPVTPTNACTGVTGGSGELASSVNAQFSSGGINKKTNKHDVIRLVNTGTTVDEFGVYLDNDWMDSTIITGDRGFNFRRLNTASQLPDPTFTLGELSNWTVIDWVGEGTASCSGNDYSDIGLFDFSTGVPPTVTLQPVAPAFACTFSASLTIAGTEGYTGPTPADTQDLAYQWYYNAPGDTNWTEILPADTNYSGQQTATLNIIDTASLDGYQYYCQLREDTATCFEASNAVKLDVRVSIWDGTDWSYPPDLDRYAILNSNYNTSNGTNGQVSFGACGLVVNSGTLTVDNSNYVEIINDVVVQTGAAILIETQAAFIQRGVGAAAGSFTLNGTATSQVNKLTAPLSNWYDYTYWSSPVATADVDASLFPASPSRRFWYNANLYIDNDNDDIDDDANDWTLATGTGQMIVGRGYAATHNNVGFISGNQYQYNFEGALNTGDYTYPLAYNAINTDHWNLVGNPYPSAIKVRGVDGLFAANAGAIKTSVYLWSHDSPPLDSNPGNENLNFNSNDYAIINQTMSTAGASGIPPGNYIPSGQSFFVSSLANTDLIFNNAMRISGDNSNNLFFRNSANSDTEPLEEARLWLNLTADGGIFNQLGVGYVNSATDGFDGLGYDAKRNLSSGSDVIIYSKIEGEEHRLAIQGKAISSLNLEEIIKIGFATSIEENLIYKFSLYDFEGQFLNEHPVYLKDNLLNTYHNLKDSDYTFTSEAGEYNNRFEIVFRTANLSIEDHLIHANGISITELTNGDVEFKLNSNQNTITNVEILDMLGRRVYNLRGNTTTEVYNLSQLSQSAYIAKITLSNGQVISKKAIKQQ